MATQSNPKPANSTLRSKLGFSARRWARRETAFLLREEDERVLDVREREEELRLAENFFLLLFLLERDCAMLYKTPLLNSI